MASRPYVRAISLPVFLAAVLGFSDLLAATQAPRVKEEPAEVEIGEIRIRVFGFLDCWLVRSDISAASHVFSKDADLAESGFDELARDLGQSYPVEFEAQLSLGLSDVRALFRVSKNLRAILSTRLLVGRDTFESMAVNEIKSDKFSLFRMQRVTPESPSTIRARIDELSARAYGKFEDILERIKNCRADEVFYMLYIDPLSKRRDDAHPMYFLWRRENKEWRIVKLGFLTD